MPLRGRVSRPPQRGGGAPHCCPVVWTQVMTGMRCSSDNCNRVRIWCTAYETSNHVNPPEVSRTYASVWNGDAIGTGHAQSMLDSPAAWSAQNNNRDQHMTIDAGAVVQVAGLQTQGRADLDQWVTHYRVEVSEDGENYSGVDGESSFPANSDRDTKVTSPALHR